MSDPFSYSIDECDVQDREKLVRYRGLAISWHELLHGDQRHSIAAQFSDMLWQDAAWRFANEARRPANEHGPTSAVAPLLGAMLDRGYVSGQVIAISRLLEKSNARDPKKGVVSLRRVVDEMRENRDVFTREIFVSHDALPYQWEAIQAQETRARIAEGSELRAYWMDTRGPSAWPEGMGRHDEFDRLSGVARDRRCREDRIADAIFDRLDSTLKVPLFTDLLALRNKTVAHAADAFSCAQVSDLRAGLKLDEFAKAHYLLLGLFQAISSTLLYGSWRSAAVPISQTDQFQHLDQPFVRPDRMGDMHAFWRRHCDERDEWLTAAFNEILPEARIVEAASGSAGERIEGS